MWADSIYVGGENLAARMPGHFWILNYYHIYENRFKSKTGLIMSIFTGNIEKDDTSYL